MHPRAEQLIRDLGSAAASGRRALCRSPPLGRVDVDLLPAGGRRVSRWHRVRSEEIWHFYEGSPLELLQLTPTGIRPRAHRARTGQRPRAAGSLRARRTTGRRRARGARLRSSDALSRRRSSSPILRCSRILRRLRRPSTETSPRRCAVRVAYEYETHTFRPHRCLPGSASPVSAPAGDEGNARRHQEFLAPGDDGRLRGSHHVGCDARDQEDGIRVGDQPARGAGAGRRHREASRGGRSRRPPLLPRAVQRRQARSRRRPISS